MRIRLGIQSLMITTLGLLSGCYGGKELPSNRNEITASTQRGQAIIEQFRCGSCHIIPGIPGAHGVVGPPLNKMSRRTFIAGEFQNNPQNLIHWVEAPTSMKPKTDMPDLGLTDQQAADVAAYLGRLR